MKEITIISVLIGLLFWFLIHTATKEQEKWNKFADTHNCKVVGKISGSTGVGYGVTSNGSMGTVITSIPGKTGYQCDDGVTYWR